MRVIELLSVELLNRSRTVSGFGPIQLNDWNCWNQAHIAATFRPFGNSRNVEGCAVGLGIEFPSGNSDDLHESF